MSAISVIKFAEILGVSIERLLLQLNEAGLPHKDGNDVIVDEQKLALLNHLRSRQPQLTRPKTKSPKPKAPAFRPKIFISYSWDSRNHKAWVKKLATRLRTDGSIALLDHWELHPGDEITNFIESSVSEADYVLIICTPNYKIRADRREGGVGYEGSVITSDLYTNSNHRKYIPILRAGSWKESAPIYLRSKLYLDMRGEPSEQEELTYRELLLTIYSRRESAPPVGVAPAYVFGDA